MVGAAVGVGEDAKLRAQALTEAGRGLPGGGHRARPRPGRAGHGGPVKANTSVDVIGGNVATRAGAQALVDAGADAVKVGVGPGRDLHHPGGGRRRRAAGHRHLRGVPGGPAGRRPGHRRRRRAVLRRHRQGHRGRRGHGHAGQPAGGLRGRTRRDGVHQRQAVQAVPRAWARWPPCATPSAGRSYSKDRYFQDDVLREDKLVPEGVEAQVPYRGPLAAVAYQLTGGLRAAMGYCGARDHRRAAAGPVHPDHRGRAGREPPARHADGDRGAELRRPPGLMPGTGQLTASPGRLARASSPGRLARA